MYAANSIDVCYKGKQTTYAFKSISEISARDGKIRGIVIEQVWA